MDLEKLDIISRKPDIDKICLYVKDPCETKYELLIKIFEGVGLKNYNDSKPSTEHSNDMDDIYGNTEEYNANKEHKMLIVFYDMIANMFRIIKLNILLDFITKFYFAVPKNNRQNSTYYFMIKIPKKRGLQQIS